MPERSCFLRLGVNVTPASRSATAWRPGWCTVRAMPYKSQSIQSTVTAEGQLKLALATTEVGDPGPEEVIVEMDAAPINPSDLGLLFGPADMSTAIATGSSNAPELTAQVPKHLLPAVGARLGQPMPVGNEGAGVVVATGDSAAAKPLLGKTVSMIGGASYSSYRKLHHGAVQVLPEGTTAVEGASWFVNPMTVLGMLETMRLEGHSALVHTAAASNLGQMLCKACQQDGVELVNIVRRPAHVELLRGLGARHVVDSSVEAFSNDLAAAIEATDATLAFDAIGGGKLAGQILGAMEKAQSKKAGSYSRYGSTTHKQVYIYGGLDRSPTTLNRNFGMAWGLGGWLLTPTLQRIGAERVLALRQRVVEGLKTTFASHYTREVSLAEALSPEAVAAYGKQATGEKYLIRPQH